MSSWDMESSQSVHWDECGMLRIISPPLVKDPTSDRDPHHHGNGCCGRTCSWGVEDIAQSKYSKVSPVCGTCKMSKHKVHLEIQWLARTKCPSIKCESVRRDSASQSA